MGKRLIGHSKKRALSFMKWYEVRLPSGQKFKLDTRARVQCFVDNNDTQLVVKYSVSEDHQVLSKRWRYNEKYYPHAKRRYRSRYLSIVEALAQGICVTCKEPCDQFGDCRAGRCQQCADIFK